MFETEMVRTGNFIDALITYNPKNISGNYANVKGK